LNSTGSDVFLGDRRLLFAMLFFGVVFFGAAFLELTTFATAAFFTGAFFFGAALLAELEPGFAFTLVFFDTLLVLAGFFGVFFTTAVTFGFTFFVAFFDLDLTFVFDALVFDAFGLEVIALTFAFTLEEVLALPFVLALAFGLALALTLAFLAAAGFFFALGWVFFFALTAFFFCLAAIGSSGSLCRKLCHKNSGSFSSGEHYQIKSASPSKIWSCSNKAASMRLDRLWCYHQMPVERWWAR